MSYVIRSMSTTDCVDGLSPSPYHVLLMKPEERTQRGAFWGRMLCDAMTFDTIEEAEAEWLRHWPADHPGRQDIVKVDDMLDGIVPAVWEEMQHRPATKETRAYYVYAEPEETRAYVDQRKRLHFTRESAIAANVEDDIRKRMEQLYNETDNPVAFMRLLRDIAQAEPQMLRDYIESMEP